jgi:Clostripain family
VDARTCELKFGVLEPDTDYAIQLNCARKGRRGFMAAGDGAPLPDSVVFFHTAPAKKPVPKPVSPEPVKPKPVKPVPGAKGLTIDLGPVQDDPDRIWTIAYYMCADNDVEMYSCEALNDIEASFPEKGVEVIVLFDRGEGFDTSEGDWKDTRVYRVSRGTDGKKVESKLIASLGELNLGDPAVLAGFMASVYKTYPARHHALLMWDHGSGWSGQAIDMGPPSAAGTHDEIELDEFQKGLAGGLAAAGLKKLDLVWFHMCLMGQVEIASAIYPYADFMVASEALIPCAAVPYGDLVASLARGRAPREAATEMVGIYKRHYEALKNTSSTSSAFDLTRTENLTVAFDGFCRKLLGEVDTSWAAMSRCLFFAESYSGRTDYRYGKHATASADLLDVVKRMRLLIQPFPAETEARRLALAIDDFVLADYSGSRRRLSNGVAVYAPMRGDMLNPEYANVPLSKQSAWLQLLAKVHEAQQRNLAKPKITDAQILGPTGKPTNEAIALGGSRVQFTIDGSNILWTMVRQVRPIKSPEGFAVMFSTFIVDPLMSQRRKNVSSEMIDLVMPEYADGATTLAREVGGLSFRITDGNKAVDATVDLSDPNDLLHARVPALYESPRGGKVRVNILFNTDWARAVAVIALVPQPDGGVQQKMIRPEADAEITLLYEVMTRDGKGALVPTGTLKWGKNGLQLLPVLQEPGEYALMLVTESIAGVSDTAIVHYSQKANPDLDDLVKRGGNFTPKQLLGDWQIQVGVARPKTGDMEWKETDWTAHYRVDPKNRGPLQYEYRMPSEGETESGLAVIDTRGAPCIVHFVPADGGGMRRAALYLAFRLADAQHETFIMKDVGTGGVFRLVRRAKTPIVRSLAGRWQNDQGAILACNDSQYQWFMNGQMMDAGTYRIEGNKIHSQNRSGMAQTVTFTLENDVLTMTDPQGQKMVLKRIQ